MRFVPAHKQPDGETASLPPARWPVELVLISNVEDKRQYVDMDRIKTILQPAICNVCQMSPEMIQFFPKTRAREEELTTLTSDRAYRPIPICPAITAPLTPTRDPPRPPRPPPPRSRRRATLPREHYEV